MINILRAMCRAAQLASILSFSHLGEFVCIEGGNCELAVGKVVGLTGFVIIHMFIASFSPAQGERNQIVNANFTRPVNAMPMSSWNI